MHPDAAHIPAATGGTYPPRTGNRFRPLIDGHDAFSRIAQAVESARRSVWVTLAFHEDEFVFPDGQDSLIDLLDRAARRGVDVRGLFWHEARLADLVSNSQIYAATSENHAKLRARGFAGRIRWDHLPDFCHHQKSWLIDAGHPGEVAFVGGINLDRGSLAARGHPPRDRSPGVDDLYAEIHDLYAEIEGPAATDVAHNFVQRWNEASERERPLGKFPEHGPDSGLEPPTRLSPEVGDATVQISRTIMPGIYRDERPPPGAPPFAIAEGEASVREQVLSAIDHARRTIYIENQIFLSRSVLRALDRALGRGVRVIAVVPRRPMRELVDFAREHPEAAAPILDQLDLCGGHDRFTLVGLASTTRGGFLSDVYVHAKIMLVDDAWATLGSTNFMGRSFLRETEMNASIWCPDTVRRLRQDLFDEHLAGACRGLGELAAFDRFSEIATANAPLFERSEALQGLAHRLRTDTYCR